MLSTYIRRLTQVLIINNIQIRQLQFYIQKFGVNQSGVVAIIFAMVAIPVIGLSLFAVNYSIVSRDRSALNDVSDAAALAGVGEEAIDLFLSDAQQVNRSEMFAREMFEALRKEGKALTSDVQGISIDAKVNGSFVEIEVCYKASMPTLGLSAVGFGQIEFSNCATASSSSPQYLEVHILVDASASMGIGADTWDQTRMEADLGCAFACHIIDTAPVPDCTIPGTASHTPRCAAQIGARLRFDVVKSAINDLIDRAEGVELVDDQFAFVVHKFSNNVVEVTQPGWSNNAVRTAVADMQMDALGAGSLIGHSLEYLAQNLPANGAGRGPNDRQILVILITDAVESNVDFFERVDGQWRQDRRLEFIEPGFMSGRNHEHRTQAINAAACDSIKAQGIGLTILHTEYLTPPSAIKERYQGLVNDVLPVVDSRLRDCASAPNLVYNAATSAEIEAAASNILNTAVATARLVQ